MKFSSIVRPAALLAVCILVRPSIAQETRDPDLPRRAFLGAALEPTPDDSGARVLSVFPGSSADAIGLEAGDVVTQLGDQPVSSPATLIDLLSAHRAGERIAVSVTRGDEQLDKTATLVEFPRETIDSCEVIYDSVPTVDGGWLRTIVTRPLPDDAENANPDRVYPAILMIQGVGCASIDQPFEDRRDPFVVLCHELAKHGIVTMRVDKSGLGDSTGMPCSELDLLNEMEGYRNAMLSLATEYPFVDDMRLFIFGHSMGGVMAPRIAEDIGVRGIAVFGTIGRNFYEYLIENVRRQHRVNNIDLVDQDNRQQVLQEFMARILFDQLTPAEVFATAPHLVSVDRSFLDDTHLWGRHASFWHQLQALPIAGGWQQLGPRTRVLAIHGEYDWVSDPVEHREIVRIANFTTPGHAEFLSLPRTDHAFTTHPSIEATIGSVGQGEFSQSVVVAILNWMDEAVSWD
ncbi:MAG: alpha/beta fold hydrolase [Phycisphaerales bacterium]|nr:alpha/beta fold hydrolase [Phycisphaerales bacterium]